MTDKQIIDEKVSGTMNKIIFGDCLQIFKQLADETFDLVCTDPPYKKVSGGCTNYAVKLTGAKREEMAKGTFFKRNEIKFADWMPEVYRLLKNDTHCYIFSDDRNLNEILTIGKKVGFKLLNILTWKKTKHCPNRYYLKNSEFIVMFRKGKAKNINNMGTFQVLEFANVEKKTHPAEKPYNLIKCLVENSSNENDLVLDPFGGSCVLDRVCKDNNRKSICIEIDSKYTNVVNKSIKKGK